MKHFNIPVLKTHQVIGKEILLIFYISYQNIISAQMKVLGTNLVHIHINLYRALKKGNQNIDYNFAIHNDTKTQFIAELISFYVMHTLICVIICFDIVNFEIVIQIYSV